jgi:parvulin-like peptidyl-prolyl isomerase
MKRLVLVFGVFLVISGQIFGQIDLQPVATVRLSKTEQITVRQFREYVNWLTIAKVMSTNNPNAKLTEAERRQALDELGNQFLACQAAEQERITVSERDINQYFDESIKNFSAGMTQLLGRAPTDAEIDTELRNRTGMSRASFRELMKRSLLTENYLKVKKQSLFDSIKQPTEAEIAAVYNEARTKSIFDNGFSRPDTAKVRMIVVPIPNAAGKAAAQTTANNLVRQIGNDVSRFDQAVLDAQKPNAGYLGGEGFVYKDPRAREAMGASFVDAVFSLKQGEVSKLLERPDGFYIVKVMETYRAQTLALTDIYNLEDPRRPTVRQVIIAAEMQRRVMATLQQASEELVAELRRKGSVQIRDDIYNQITW